MWESIKNDPILKSVVVIVLGVLAFGFAFNIMFGGNGSAMGHGGTPLNSVLTNGLEILTKILLIILVVAAISFVVKYLKKYLLQGEDIRLADALKNDKVIRWGVVIGAFLLLLALMPMIFNSSAPGLYRNEMMGTSMYNNMISPNYSMGIYSVLFGLVNILLAVSVIGLIVGIVLHLKADYLSVNGLKEKCASCGRELNTDWTCCPSCGTEKKVAVKRAEPEKKVVSDDSVPEKTGIDKHVVDALLNSHKKHTEPEKKE